MPRSFKQMLSNVSASENAVYDAILETAAYIVQQYHQNRTKDGAGEEYLPQFLSAIRTKWLREKVAALKLQSGKKLGAISLESAALMVAPRISEIFHAQKAKRIETNAKRTAKKAQEAHAIAPESTNATPEGGSITLDGEYEVETCTVAAALICPDGEVLEISDEEATALRQLLMQMRGRQVLANQNTLRTGTHG